MPKYYSFQFCVANADYVIISCSYYSTRSISYMANRLQHMRKSGRIKNVVPNLFYCKSKFCHKFVAFNFFAINIKKYLCFRQVGRKANPQDLVYLELVRGQSNRR